MPILLSQAEFLISNTAQTVLKDSKYVNLDLLKLSSIFRKQFTGSESIALTQQIQLRKDAKSKFKDSSNMLFTREALEQSTHYIISEYRRKFFPENSPYIDLCCGIGGDLLSRNYINSNITAYELDPVHLLFAKWNFSICNPNTNCNFLLEDSTNAIFNKGDSIFADPQRRSDAKRNSRNYDSWSPSLKFLLDLPKINNCITGLKLSPMTEHADFVNNEFNSYYISLFGELKEFFLITENKKNSFCTAVVLPSGEEITSDGEIAEIGDLESWIHEADAAVIKSGALGAACRKFNMKTVADKIAYSTSSSFADTALFSSYKILDSDYFSIKKLKEWCKLYKIGYLIVKKRGFGETPEKVLAQLSLKGKNKLTCFIYRIGNTHNMVLTKNKNIND